MSGFRKAIEEGIEKDIVSYTYLKNIVESSLDIICKIDQSGRFVWLNSACERIWGYKPCELVGKKYINFVVARDHSITQETAEKIMAGKDYTNFENSYIRKDGSVVPMAWSARWVASEQIMHCVARDATEKVNAQTKLQEREHSLKEAMRIARMGTWTYDASSNTAVWSDELYELYGVNKDQSDDLVSLFTSMVHEEDAAIIEQAFLHAKSMVKPFTHRLFRPDGKMIYVQQRVSQTPAYNGQHTIITGTAQDITDEVEHQTELLYREQRFKALLENNQDMVGIIDSVGNYTYVSENTESITGYKPEDLLGKNAFDLIHSEDAQLVFEQFSCVGAPVKTVDIPPFRFKSAHGEWRWIECKVTDRSQDPLIRGYIINSRDVTLRKTAEEKILSLSRIAEDTPNAVVITGIDGKITWVNKAFSKITGYSPEESLNRKPGEFLQGKDSSPVTIALMRQRILERKPFEVEIINYTKSGKGYWMNIQCQPQVDASGKVVGFFAIQTDITEKKNLQERLNAELEKRQMMITAEIVKAQEKERDEIGKELHDNVNQVLSTVKLYLEMLKEPGLNKEELITKSISFIQDSIDELRHISKRLSSPHHNELQLQEAVEQLVQSISAGNKLNIVYKPHNIENCTASVDVQLAVYRIMQEHLTNVLKHAAASNVEVSLACIANVLNVKIVDDGKGFEVKAKRKGVGISNIMNRAVAVNGKVEIRSAPGAGCTLHGMFPV